MTNRAGKPRIGMFAATLLGFFLLPRPDAFAYIGPGAGQGLSGVGWSTVFIALLGLALVVCVGSVTAAMGYALFQRIADHRRSRSTDLEPAHPSTSAAPPSAAP